MTVQSAPQREIGYAAEAGPNSYNWWMSEGETTPELRWPQSVQVYDQMRTQDAQIKSVLAAVTFPVRRTPWRIDPNGARDEVVRLVADDLGLPVVGESKPNMPLRTKDRFSWAEHVRLALLMLPFGHMMFEQVYRVTEDGSRAHLRKLGERLPRTIFDIKVARDGGLVSITQTASTLEGNYQQQPIPVNRLVAYVLDKEGGNWLGRALALDTPIPTPDGYRAIGDLVAGDKVFDESGAVCTVTATRRWSNRPCFRLQFDDGEEIVADENHQWLSYVRVGVKRVPRVVTTAEMAAAPTKYGVPHHAVPLAGALDLPDVDLPVDPYVLGAWLGDGSHSTGTARIVDAEGDVVAEIERRGYDVRRLANWEVLKSYAITGLPAGLRKAGIFTGTGKRTPYMYDKHVPDVYLRASRQQRLDLLRGLMDTDGHFDVANGQCNFNNTNKALSMAVAELAASLGAKVRIQYVRQAGSIATMKSGAEIHSRKDIYRIKFTAQFVAFTMERKAKQQDMERASKRPYHYVRAIDVAENRDTVCIEVDSPSHLYLCGIGHKPTHNSILRPAYKNWLLKDRLLRVQAQTVERNGMGVPTYTGAEGEADLAKGKALATSLRAGETAGAAIPYGATLALLGVTGTLPDADTPIRYHDEQIARAVLAHFLNLGTQTGSWALGTTFADFFTLSLQTLADQIADTATQHVVEDLVDINWGPNEPAPRIVHDEIGSRQQATAAAIKSLVDAGILEPDEVLESSTRQQYGLPPKDPDTTRGQDQGGFADALTGGQGTGQPFYAPPDTGSGSEVYASADIDDYDDDEPGQFDEMTAALAAALSEFTGEVRAAGLADWDPSKHPRDRAGRFRTVFARVMHALEQWARGEGGDHPLKGQGFTTANLRTVATKHLGLKVRRSSQNNPVTPEELEDLILEHVRAHVRVVRDRKADEPKRQAKFTLQSGELRDKDVAVYRMPGDKPALFHESESGKRGGLVERFDDLDGLAAWADEHGETRLAEWARKEAGGKAPTKAVPSATKAAPAKRVPPAPGFADDLAEEFYRNPNYTKQEIRERLDGLTVAELKKVATATNVEKPRDFHKTEAGAVVTTLKTLTADEWREHIAAKIVGDRTQLGSSPTPAKKAPGGAPRGEGVPAGNLPSGADIEVVQSTRNLSNTQIVQGHTLTVAGQRALDALGPAGHPRIAAIPDTEEKIREAYRMLAVPGGGQDSYVALIDVRKLIGEQVPRSEVDDVLRRLQRARGDVRLEEQAYGRHNVAERVPASIRMGGTELSLLHIDDPTLSRPSQFPAVDMAQELVNRRDGGPRHPMMVNLSDADLRAEVDRRMANDPIVGRDVASIVPGYASPTPAKKAPGRAVGGYEGGGRIAENPRRLTLKHADAARIYEWLTSDVDARGRPRRNALALTPGIDVTVTGAKEDRLVLSKHAVEVLSAGRPGREGTIDDTPDGPALFFFGEHLPLSGQAPGRAAAAPTPDLPDASDPEALRDALDLRTVDQLKAMLRQRGLAVSGRKRDLVDRLVDGGGVGPKAEPATSASPVTGDAALRATSHNLEALTAAGDPRADSLWYRTGDNSLETADGRVGAFKMNEQMRTRTLDPEMRARVKDIVSVMAESRTTAPIVVYRGVDSATKLGQPGRRVGKVFTDRAFVSTSTDDAHAAGFGGTLMRIHVPAGTSAIRLADRPGDDSESEILLNRGLHFRIISEQPGGGPRGANVIDVEIVP